MSITVDKSHHTIGAVVYDVSLSKVPKDIVLGQIEDALEEHGVLVFPKQHAVTPEQQIAFSKNLDAGGLLWLRIANNRPN